MQTARTRTLASRSPAAVPPAPELSIVVTVLDEEAGLEELYRRTVAALDAAGRSFELIFIDDGSRDGSFALLERLHAADPRVRAVRLKRNVGQHPAMHAGLSRARGEIVVTMDADLQNAPEDIDRLVRVVEAGADVASGRRGARRDPWVRTVPSRLVNGMLRRFTGVPIADFGCAFNAYRRAALQPVLAAIGKQKFTKALVLASGASVVEVDVAHGPRADRSRYGPVRLVRLALHVVAGFWPRPIQWIGLLLGALCGILSLGVAIWGLAYWIAEADFAGFLFLAGLVLLVLGIQGFILALVGEYLGRIRRDVEGWPLYVVDKEVE